MTTPETTAAQYAERYRNSDIESLDAPRPKFEFGQVCEHGQLARSCSTCDDKRDIEHLRNMVFALRAQVADLQPRGTNSVLVPATELAKLRAQVEQYSNLANIVRLALEIVAFRAHDEGRTVGELREAARFLREIADAVDPAMTEYKYGLSGKPL